MLHKIFGLIGVILIAAACNLTAQQPTSMPPTAPPPTEVASSCLFSAYGIGEPHNIYASADGGEVITQANMNDQFPAVGTTEYWYQVTVGELTGYVSRSSGDLSGDCDAIPFTRLLDAPPEGVCSLRLDSQPPIINVIDYENVQSGQAPPVIAQMPNGTWLTVIAQAQITGLLAYKIMLPDGQSGWIDPAPLQQGGLINGECESLPEMQIDFVGG